MVKFWEVLPEDVYRQWQANKFKNRALDTLNTMTPEGVQAAGQAAPELLPPSQPNYAFQSFASDFTMSPVPSNPLEEGVTEDDDEEVIGADAGAWVRKAKRSIGKMFKGIGEGIDSGKDAAGAGINWYQKNVVPYGAGLIEGTLGHTQEFEGEKSLGPVKFHWKNLPGAQFDAKTVFGGPSAWKKNYEDESRDMSGVQKFLFESGGDPLNAVGMYGKGVAAVPGLGKVGRGISAIEAAPGKGMSKAIGGGKGLFDRVGALTGLNAPSTRGKATEISERAANLIREQAQTFGGGFTRPDARGTGNILSRIDAMSTSNPDAAAAAIALKELKRAGVDPNTLNPMDLYMGTRDRVFKDYTKAVHDKVLAERATQGVKGKVLNAADTVMDKAIRPITQGTSKVILGTAGFPLMNIPEARLRAGLSGGSMGSVDTLPFLSTKLDDVGHTVADLPIASRHLDNGGAAATAVFGDKPDKFTWGKVPKEALTGELPIRASRALTAGPERKAYLEMLQREMAKLDPSLPWAERAKQVVAAADQQYQKYFPVGGTETRFEAAARSVFPFWGYESRRLPFLAQMAAEHPGAITAKDRYSDLTDNEYIDLPGPVDINPTRGNILGGVGALGKPDYPTYAKGKSGAIEAFTDEMGDWGFYPSLPVNAALMGLRMVEGEPAEPGALVPSTIRSRLGLVQGMGEAPVLEDIPGVEGTAKFATRLQGTFGDDRFRQYYINKVLAERGIEPEKATREQRLEAAQIAGLQQGLAVESGLVRFKSEDEKAYREALKAAAREAGVPDTAMNDKSNPISAKDEQGNFILPSQIRAAIYDRPENQWWKPWQQVSQPLRHPDERRVEEQTRAYYDTLDRIQTDLEAQLYPAYAEMAKGAASTLSGDDFRRLRREAMAQAQARREQAAADHPLATKTREEREAFAARTGREGTGPNPLDAVAEQYRSIEPQTDAFGRADLRSFFQSREQFLNSLGSEERAYIENKKRWQNPEMEAVEQSYQGAMGRYRDIQDREPQYRGLNEQHTEALNAAQDMAAAIRAANPGIDSGRVRQMIARVNPIGARLLPYANRLRNPNRKKALAADPELLRFFQDVAPSSMPAAQF